MQKCFFVYFVFFNSPIADPGRLADHWKFGRASSEVCGLLVGEFFQLSPLLVGSVGAIQCELYIWFLYVIAPFASLFDFSPFVLSAVSTVSLAINISLWLIVLYLPAPAAALRNLCVCVCMCVCHYDSLLRETPSKISTEKHSTKSFILR